MKVLFLDVDGVLNGVYTVERFNGKLGVEPTKCRMIRDIVEHTGTKIVLSSSWRKNPPNVVHLQERLNLPEGTFLGHTPVLDEKQPSGLYAAAARGAEIQQWLDENPGVDRMVIFDDKDDMLHLVPHLLQTNPFDGITADIVLEAVRRLNGQPSEQRGYSIVSYARGAMEIQKNITKAEHDEIAKAATQSGVSVLESWLPAK